MPWTHGVFYWNELMAWDVERAKRFYGEAIGWSYEPMQVPDGTYWIIKAGDTTVGGMFQLSQPHHAGVPEGWMAYLAVDDIDARLERAVAAGGTVMRPAFDIPGVGRIAILKEPGGAGIGWITPASA